LMVWIFWPTGMTYEAAEDSGGECDKPQKKRQRLESIV
jgi:hypothetical protein